MSVDERLRSAMADQARSFEPSVDSALSDVRARGRRTSWRRGLPLIAAAAVAAAVAGTLTWLEPGRLEVVGDPPPATTMSPSVQPSAPLRGALSAEVTVTGLVGAWRLQLNGNGTIDVEPPESHLGVVSGAAFTSDGDTFRTTLLGGDECAGMGTGIYGWLAVGDTVEFTVVSDPCRIREAFFTEPDWSMSTEPSPRG